MFYRQNNIPPVQKTNGKIQFRRLPKGCKKGIADIRVVCRTGINFDIEVKTDKGRQSEDQKLIQSMMEKMGGNYYIVRSLRDVQDIIEPHLGRKNKTC